MKKLQTNKPYLIELDSEVAELEQRAERLLREGYPVKDVIKMIVPDRYFLSNIHEF